MPILNRNQRLISNVQENILKSTSLTINLIICPNWDGQICKATLSKGCDDEELNEGFHSMALKIQALTQKHNILCGPLLTNSFAV